MSSSVHELNSPPPQFVNVDDYQKWVSENWIYPASSLEFQLHSRMKLEEEAREVTDELDTNDPEALRLELGDLLWSATATALNSGITLNKSLHYMYPGAFDEGEPISLAVIDEKVSDWSPSTDEQIRYKLINLAFDLGKNAKQWHGLRDAVEEGEELKGYFFLKVHDAMQSLAQIVTWTSHIAQQRLDLSLADIMKDNYDKLTGRTYRGEQITRRPEA